MKLGIAIVSVLLTALVLYLADVPTRAGAHPRWADQVLLSGVIIGTVLALISQWIPAQMRLVGFSILAGLSYLVAWSGKERFAASYAEDVLAGQMWYFGWHALCIFMVAAAIAGTYKQLTASSDPSKPVQ